MERIATFFLKNRAFSWLLLLLVVAGGIFAYVNMGKLEDAPFTIKQAVVTTSYPGASPMEVQQQVTDILEEAIQSLGELYYLKTDNRAGLSKITVYVKKEIRADEMQQLWDKLRRKVGDAQSKLPAGAGPSVVNDDFGDVLGVFYGLSSSTHSYRELEDEARRIKNEILTVSDGNVVEMAQLVADRLDTIKETLPAGYDLDIIYDQGYESDVANDGFVMNLILSVITVVGVLLFFIGFKNGFLIGSGLIFSILGTLIYMEATGIALQRMSLAAIIIAMGMLVDNAIVVYDATLVNMQRGMRKRQAIQAAVKATSMPLLGATLIAVLTFLPVYLSPHITGEILSSLFIVIAVSLLLSWVLAITQNVFFVQEFVRRPRPEELKAELFNGKVYDMFRKALGWTIRHRYWVTGSMVVRPYRTRFLISGAKRFYTVQVADVAYFYSVNKVTFAVTRDGESHVVDFTLNKLEEQLDERMFMRVNRQFILSADCIKSIQNYFNGKALVTVKPPYDGQIQISRDRITSLKMWLNS